MKLPNCQACPFRGLVWIETLYMDGEPNFEPVCGAPTRPKGYGPEIPRTDFTAAGGVKIPMDLNLFPTWCPLKKNPITVEQE